MMLNSCEKNEGPKIKNVEIGTENSSKVYVGDELHVEATILAEKKIASIRLTIHSEEHGTHVISSLKMRVAAIGATEWEVDSTYRGVYANVKNTEFHEHIDIPTNAETGSYHLHLYVTDMDGNQAIFEDEFNLLAK